MRLHPEYGVKETDPPIEGEVHKKPTGANQAVQDGKAISRQTR